MRESVRVVCGDTRSNTLRLFGIALLILKMGTHLAQSRASVRSFMGADGRADSHKNTHLAAMTRKRLMKRPAENNSMRAMGSRPAGLLLGLQKQPFDRWLITKWSTIHRQQPIFATRSG